MLAQNSPGCIVAVDNHSRFVGVLNRHAQSLGIAERLDARVGDMPRLDLDSAPDASGTLLCGLTPSGRIDVFPGSPDEGPGLSTAVQRRVIDAFSAGRGHGVLHLGAGELSTDFHPTLSYWRDIGRSFVASVCGALDPTDPTSLVIPDPDPDEITAFSEAVPPMPGAELLTPALLGDLWSDLGKAVTLEAARFKDGGIQGYLKKQSSVWNVVGRVCLHLAENKHDLDYPFAFIATYVHKVSTQAKPEHVPLGQALQEYAGAKNRQKLLALLSPLSRAAKQSDFIRELVDAGDIYHPLSWTPTEAHRFLCEVALYEQAGLVVRMPNWWSAKTRRRPKVSVSVGGKAPSTLGMSALLDFDVKLTLDGRSLSRKEIDALLASTEGLVLIKGTWVEVDKEKLGQVLDQWRDVQRQAQAGRVSFGEAMRMLAGAQLGRRRLGRHRGTSGRNGLRSSRANGSRRGSTCCARPSCAPRSTRTPGCGPSCVPTRSSACNGSGRCAAWSSAAAWPTTWVSAKTIQVLGVLSLSRRNQEPGTDLLVVPASLVDNWRLEIERFAPQLEVLIAHPSRIPSPELKQVSKQTVDAHDAVITTYGTAMRTEWIKSHAWRNVILDEAQAIKNPGAKQTKAVKALDSRWRLALTGTPVENRLGDLWSIFDFLNPGCWARPRPSTGSASPWRRADAAATRPYAGSCSHMSCDGSRPTNVSSPICPTRPRSSPTAC